MWVIAAVLYTGGPRPYGYSGFGELAVLAFFGVVGTCGSAYVQLERVPAAAAVASVVVGLGAVAILLANNVRDIDGDRLACKRTLAVRLGRDRSRGLFTAVVAYARRSRTLARRGRPVPGAERQRRRSRRGDRRNPRALPRHALRADR